MRIAIVVAEHFTDAGLAIAVDVLRAAASTARRLGRGEPWTVRVCARVGGAVRTASGLSLHGLGTWRSAERADVVLVPGVWLEDTRQVERWLESPELRALAQVVARAYRRGARVLGSCSGVLALAAAGVLDDQPATTVWWAARPFSRAFPKVRLDVARALVVAGRRVVTAGAVFAMADLALHLVRTELGPEVARWVTRYLLLDEHPAQAPYMALAQLSAEDDALVRAERWLRAHLTAPISVEALARSAGTSARTLTRRVREHLATTPARWVRRIRAEEAARLLATTALPVERIAERVGFGSSLGLRRALREVGGVTPLALRRRARAGKR